MKVFNIYLAGGMKNISFEEYRKRRDTLTKYLYDAFSRSDYYDNQTYKLRVIDPSLYYNYEERLHETEKEIMNFELNQLRKSDLVIVDFIDPHSLGTMTEMAIAYEHRIPVLGLNEKNNLHPWQREMCDRLFKDLADLLNYVGGFYFN